MLLKNLSTKIAVVAALASSIFMFIPAQAYENKSSLPLQGQELDIGLNYAPPFVVIDGAFDNVKGIDVDIIKELQRRTGFTLNRGRFQIMSFGELMDLAGKGDLDLIAGVMSLNPARAQKFTQSPGLFRSYQVVVVPANSNIKTLDDLAGKTIAAQAGTNSSDILPAHIANSTKLHHEVTTFMTFYSVISGKAQALVTEEPMAQALIDNWAKGKLKILYRIDQSVSDFGYMMKKDTKISQVLHDELLKMREDGTIANIVQKYLPNYEFPSELYSKDMRIAAAKAEQKAKALRQAANQNNVDNNQINMSNGNNELKLPKESNTPVNQPNFAQFENSINSKLLLIPLELTLA